MRTDRPIIFNAEMVRAILRWDKTQTRRPMNPQPQDFSDPPLVHWQKHPAPYIDEFYKSDRWCWWTSDNRQGPGWYRCPFGVPGDTLWVRETCRAEELDDGLDVVVYEADGEKKPIGNTIKASESWIGLHSYRGGSGLKVPSIHMPRWVSRIDLRITRVRAERLQDITREDALAEGVHSGRSQGVPTDEPVEAFLSLWESIYANSAANPWVWAVDFERIGGGA